MPQPPSALSQFLCLQQQHQRMKFSLTHCLTHRVLEDLAAELSEATPSVQLNLSTMTAAKIVIASKTVSDLQVRGLNSEMHIKVEQAYT